MDSKILLNEIYEMIIDYENLKCYERENVLYISFDHDGYHYLFNFSFMLCDSEETEYEPESFGITITSIEDNSPTINLSNMGTDSDLLPDSSFPDKYTITDIKNFLTVKREVCRSFARTKYAETHNAKNRMYTVFPILNKRILKKYGFNADCCDLNGEWLKLDLYDSSEIIMGEIGKFWKNKTTKDEYSNLLYYYLWGKKTSGELMSTFEKDFKYFMRFIDENSYQ